MRTLGLIFLAGPFLACGPEAASSGAGGSGGVDTGISGGGPNAGGRVGTGGGPAGGGGGSSAGSSGGAQPTGGTGGDVAGVGGEVSQEYLRRIDRFCDARCEALRQGSECPPQPESCELSCLNDGKQAKELGCTFSQVLDCLDAHPEVFNVSCETGVQMSTTDVCDAVSDEYTACVAAAKGQE